MDKGHWISLLGNRQARKGQLRLKCQNEPDGARRPHTVATAAEQTILAAFKLEPLKAAFFLEAMGLKLATAQGCDRTELEQTELDRVLDSILRPFLYARS